MVDQCDLGSPVCIDALNESAHLTEGLPPAVFYLSDTNLSLPVSTVHPPFSLRALPIGASTYIIFYGVPQQQPPSKLFAGDVELALPKKGEPLDASFHCILSYTDSLKRPLREGPRFGGITERGSRRSAP